MTEVHRDTGQRLLVMVLAYNAEQTLTWVLRRIPASVLTLPGTRVLVLDDASTDATVAVAKDFTREHPEIDVEVVAHAKNLGYGGNQKTGYRYARDHGFDLVAMIHGDGQYAPEELDRLLLPLQTGVADAVMGSRMLEPGGARRGGMPGYKFIGNKVLTSTQNLLLGTHFSEFHSGYRLYRVETLTRLDLETADNGFPFDTEIILRLLGAGARVHELPIPTYYGDEICRVNGLHYAWRVFSATTAHAVRAHLPRRRSRRRSSRPPAAPGSEPGSDLGSGLGSGLGASGAEPRVPSVAEAPTGRDCATLGER